MSQSSQLITLYPLVRQHFEEKPQVTEKKPNRGVDTGVRSGAQCSRMAKASIPDRLGLRPTEQDFRIMSKLKDKLGVDTSQIIRLALRKLAEAEDVKVSG